jgi:nucleoside-diphosphate-sugar epimerase
MTVLVTGANGFLGTVLMSRNRDFLGTDLIEKNQKVFFCDLREGHDFEKIIIEHQVTEIIHLAGVQFNSYIPPKARNNYFHQNILMAETISNAANSTGVKKIVYVSTDMVYGDKVFSPVNEEDTPYPIGEYGASKLAAEGIFMDSSNSYEFIILRPRLILGKGRVGTILKLANLIKSPFPVVLIGNGKNKYQFIAAEDVCAAIELSLKKDLSGIFNIGSDNPPNLDVLFAETFLKLNRKKIILKIPIRLAIMIFNFLDTFSLSPLTPEQYRIAGLDFVLNTDKIKSQLGWSPTKSDQSMLFEALDDLLES